LIVTQPAPTVTDSMVRSQSGRIIQNILSDGPLSEIWNYTLDAAGRLTQAVLDDGSPVTPAEHILSYEFASTGTCGVNTRAGIYGNRTGFTDVKDGVTVTVLDYCYDWADRLTAAIPSSSIPQTPGGTPVLGVLTTAGASPSLRYDGHGNTIRLADQTCVDIVVTEIYGEAQTAAGLEPFVELSGQIRLPAGSILRSEVVPEGMVGSFGALDLQSLESIVIRFTGPDDEFAAGFGGRGVLTVPTGSWLQTDGTISSTACD